MFRLHDRTRRRIALGAFFFLCIVPTVTVAVWGLWRHMPWHARSEADRLGRELGLVVALQAVGHPKPGVVQYDGLELADPESGEPLLRCSSLRAAWRPASGVNKPGTLVLTATKPEVRTAGLEPLWRAMDRRLLRARAPRAVNVRLSAAELALGTPDAADTLTEVQGRVDADAEWTTAELTFKLAGFETPEPVRVRLGRNRTVRPSTTGFELSTGGGPLPCYLLAAGLEVLEPLGPRCTFQGYVGAGNQADGWAGELAGRFTGVDLGRIVSDRFPHTLTGEAEITVDRARFRQGRLVDAVGTIDAGPGQIGQSLIEAGAAQMELRRGYDPAAPGPRVPYEKLAVSVAIDARGVLLRGRCPSDTPGVIVMGRYRPLVGEPLAEPQPVTALVAMLAPPSRLTVPATPQAEWLIRRLPVPATVSAQPPVEVASRPGQ